MHSMPKSTLMLVFVSLIIGVMLVIYKLRTVLGTSESRSIEIRSYVRTVGSGDAVEHPNANQNLTISSSVRKTNPDVSLDVKRKSNANVGLMDSQAMIEQLFQEVRYFDLSKTFSGVKRRNVTLSPIERSRVKVCVNFAGEDYQRSESTFWGIASLRWTHHTYLNSDSVVVEVGGNVGLDAEEFIKLYNITLVTFEILPTYAAKLRKKFRDNTKVDVINLGLGAGNDVTKILITGEDGDASSMFAKGDNSGGEWVIIRNTTEVFTQMGLGAHKIDLLHVNCEGCEFDVLEAITRSDMIMNIRNIQFATHSQFSNRISNLTERYCKLQERLKRTHQISYQYKVLWQSWTLK